MQNEWILIIFAVAIVMAGTWFIGRLRQPMQAYIRMAAAVLLCALIWLFPNESGSGPRAILTLLAAYAIYRSIVVIKKHKASSKS